MPEDEKNTLGSLIRTARRTADLSLQAVGDKTQYSTAYISKIELDQLPDGPSLDCLRKLSEVLHLDFEQLKALKAVMQQEASASAPATSPANARLTAAEEEMLVQFRRAGRPLQEFLLAQGKLSYAYFGRGASTQGAEAPCLVITDAPGMTDEIRDRIAGDLLFLGNSFNQPGLSQYSLDLYRKAEALYRQSGDDGGIALTHHNMGRAFFSLEANDPELSQKRFDYLQLADEYFQKADKEFNAAGNLTMRQRYGYAKNPVQWAYCDMRTAILRLRQGGQSLTEGEQEDIRRPYRLRAVPKREKAIALLRALIGDLEERPQSNDRDDLLARAFLQLGRALRDVGIEKVLAKEAADFSSEALPFFLRSGQIRGRLAEAALDEAERARQIIRLANVHQELGYGFMRGCTGKDRYGKALYQYEVGRRLLALAGVDAGAARVRYINKLENALDIPGEEEARCRLSTVLDRIQISGLTQVKLDYPFTLPEAG